MSADRDGCPISQSRSRDDPANLTTTDVARVAGPAAMLGIVTIDPNTCTMCMMCTQTCPTGAGRRPRRQWRADELLRPRGWTACDQCVRVCPEVARGAIAVDHRFDFAALAPGRVELNRSATHTCERCGQPVAPTRATTRVPRCDGTPGKSRVASSD
ncbi:MAG: 4Fe-4S binding protein [Acidobacteria bacterium]|nr:4Fe-4S binding protein [Acidobacteriota bacterium]